MLAWVARLLGGCLAVAAVVTVFGSAVSEVTVSDSC